MNNFIKFVGKVGESLNSTLASRFRLTCLCEQYNWDYTLYATGNQSQVFSGTLAIIMML